MTLSKESNLYDEEWVNEVKCMFEHIQKCPECNKLYHQWFMHYWKSPEQYKKDNRGKM